MSETILVPFDGSKYSNKAVREAVSISKKSGAKLVILSVVDITDEFEAQAPGLTDKLSKKTRILLDKIADKITAANIDVVKEVHIGDPYEIIVTTAKKKKADLIVMGSRGLGGVKEFFLGSVSDRVADEAKCPVVVVR